MKTIHKASIFLTFLPLFTSALAGKETPTLDQRISSIERALYMNPTTQKKTHLVTGETLPRWKADRLLFGEQRETDNLTFAKKPSSIKKGNLPEDSVRSLAEKVLARYKSTKERNDFSLLNRLNQLDDLLRPYSSDAR